MIPIIYFPMTVLWVELVSELGGAQRSLYEVCVALKGLGTNVVVAAPYGPLFTLLSEAGITVFPVSALRAHKHGWGLFVTTAKLLRAPSTVSQIVRAVKPDVIHANSLPALIAVAKATTHIPIFWHVRDLQLPALVARESSKHAERIIAASGSIDEYLVEILSPRVLGHIRVIRNGIDLSRFAGVTRQQARQDYGLPPERPIVGMIAHVVPWKKHDVFIRAAAEIHQQRPDAFFVIVGRDLFGEHGRYLAKLKEQIHEAGLENCVKWFDNVDSTNALLPAFDVLIHPATSEPFGRVICEAMASKVPVVAADSAGPVALIRSGISGILVQNGDAHLFAQETLSLLDDPARAARIANEGLKRVQEEFAVQRVGVQLKKEYESVLDSERRGKSDGSDDE